MKTLLKLREILALVLVDWTKPLYVRWFKKRRRAWNQSVVSLNNHPEGSLGKSLGLFLVENNFSLMPKLEDHDVLHVLLGYKTTVAGEIKMQFFLLGNRKRSLYALFTVCVGVLLVPEKIKSFLREFAKGQNAARVSHWDFEHLLSEPLALLQKQVFGKELNDQPIRF